MLLLLATLIVTSGLLIGNVAVIIGGMILAPLLVPLLSISLSLVSRNAKAFCRSLNILMISIVIALVTATGLTFAFAEAKLAIHWIPETLDTSVYIFIAFCSGIAAAFAWVKENLSSSIAGVAVAVSLLPPLCAAGIGIALWQPVLIYNSSVLFLANLIGICAAGYLVFLILGFMSTGAIEEKAIKKTENGN